jgi:WG containing repeat
MNARPRKTLICALIAIAGLAASSADALLPPPMHDSLGFIDHVGSIIVPPACDRVTIPGAGDWVSLERDGKQGFLNLRTRQATGLVFDADNATGALQGTLFAYGPEPVRKGAMFGYVDQNGQLAIPFRYSSARQFADDGLAVAAIGGKFGFIDRSGSFVIPARFDYAGDFDALGFARVGFGGLSGKIDRRGRIIVPAKFNSVGNFSKAGLAIVSLNGLKGAVDVHGDVVVPIKFTALSDFSSNGLAAASLDFQQNAFPQKEGHWGFIDKTGAFVIPPAYVRVTDFETEKHTGFPLRAPPGLASANSVDASGLETTTYIDRRGRSVITLPTGITGVFVNSNGLVEVFDGRNPKDLSVHAKFGLFNPKEPNGGPIWFDGLGEFGNNGLAPVWENFLWGYVDQSGSIAIEPQFGGASEFGADGLAPVKVKGASPSQYRVAFINKTGKVEIQTTFDDATPFSASGFAMVSVRRPWDQPNGLAASQCSARMP